MDEQIPGAPMGGAGAPPAAPRALTADPEQASPAEQEAYERFVSRGLGLIYDATMFPRIIDLLEGEGDPIEGLARASSMVVSRVMTSAKEAGVDLGGDVVFHGATELFEDLAELSRRAGIKDFAEDEDAFEGAYFRALDQLRMTLEGSGDLNREAAEADLATLQQMDEAGELETFFRSLAAGDDTGAAPTSGGEELSSASEPAPPPPTNTPPKKRGLMPEGMN